MKISLIRIPVGGLLLVALCEPNAARVEPAWNF
jgi:hypothetical protein